MVDVAPSSSVVAIEADGVERTLRRRMITVGIGFTATVLLIVLGCLLTVVGSRRDADFDHPWTVEHATVVDLHSPGTLLSSPSIDVRLTDGGSRVVLVSLPDGTAIPSPGDDITILVDPLDPNLVTVPGGATGRGMAWNDFGFMAVLAGVLCGWYAVLVWLDVRRQRAILSASPWRTVMVQRPVRRTRDLWWVLVIVDGGETFVVRQRMIRFVWSVWTLWRAGLSRPTAAELAGSPSNGVLRAMRAQRMVTITGPRSSRVERRWRKAVPPMPDPPVPPSP